MSSIPPTWENALIDRLANRPATIQIETRRDGSFIYRYDFSQAEPTNSFVVGAQFGNSAVEALSILGGATNSATVWRVDGAPATNGVPVAGLFASAPRLELRWANAVGWGDLSGDSDNDGLTDWEERYLYATHPTEPDTDGDGMADGYEIQHGTDPLDRLPHYEVLFLIIPRLFGGIRIMNKSFHLGIALFLVAGGAYLGIRHQKNIPPSSMEEDGTGSLGAEGTAKDGMNNPESSNTHLVVRGMEVVLPVGWNQPLESTRTMVELAIDELGEYGYDRNAPIRIEEDASFFIVTFPEPFRGDDVDGADFAAKVRFDKTTGKILDVICGG